MTVFFSTYNFQSNVSEIVYPRLTVVWILNISFCRDYRWNLLNSESLLNV